MLIGSIAATLAGAVMMPASMAEWAAIFGVGSDDEEGGSASSDWYLWQFWRRLRHC